MEKDRLELKHICKFCNKRFPCGRSLGGHMRSHLVTISSDDHHKLPKKKLPPLVNGHGLVESRKTTKKFSKYTLLEGKTCEECGKSFQSWKALFGHMKCHSVNSCYENQKLIMDSQSDNEAANPLCRRKKRSDRMKRYTANKNSSSLIVAKSSISVSEIDDQQEQEEVALSLIILSRDKGDWGGINSVLDSSGNSSEFLEVAKSECLKFKKLRNGKLEPTILNSKSLSIPRNETKTRKLDDPSDEFECNESEVNSPKNLIKGSGFGQFENESKKNKSRKRKLPLAYAPFDSDKLCQDFEKNSKFSCSICKKAFPSYQALGGHRASHKKFKGFCAPRSENSHETENSHNQSANSKQIATENLIDIGLKKNKEHHECPICFKVFASGQALGGHKRSHLIGDQAKTSRSDETQHPIRDFLDLNLPAPAEEDRGDFKPAWWIATSHEQQQPLLGLLS